MLEDLPSARGIVTATEALLRKAEVNDRLPTPVDDLVSAAGLSEPSDSALSESALRRAPAHLRAAMAPLRRKVRALLDRRAREVHVASTVQHDGQRAFKRLHEVGHDILPWQGELAYADDDLTLAWTVKALQEQEANQAAAELLFQRELFGRIAHDYRVSMAAVVELSQLFGASIHSAFRRYVETHRTAVAGVVLDSQPTRRDPIVYRRREAVHSTAWAKRYEIPAQWPRLLGEAEFAFVSLAPWATMSFTATRDSVSWRDRAGSAMTLEVEVFSNTYSTFVLLWQPRHELLKRRRVLVA